MSNDLDQPGAVPYEDEADAPGFVQVFPPDGKVRETAVVLTDGADKHGYPQESITFSGDHFVIPAGLADELENDLPEGTDSRDETKLGSEDPQRQNIGANGGAVEGLPDAKAPKKDYEAFADAKGLDVDKTLSAAEYKTAVRAAVGAPEPE